MKRVLISAAILGFASAAAAQTASDPSNLAAGERLARDVCAECHIVADDQAGSGRIDAPPFHEVVSDPETTGFSLRAFLRTPHYAMPNIILSPEETDDVVAYILSLKGR